MPIKPLPTVKSQVCQELEVDDGRACRNPSLQGKRTQDAQESGETTMTFANGQIFLRRQKAMSSVKLFSSPFGQITYD